ncbi:gamma-glutamyl-gamma-aminobutyrate hydrolase family protein [Streptomyces sp. NPDC053474]|uniref:glutamine amidotransferase-related protein n=1 Tax=Streptomyces sp. NPDC053474 TaxID=3365704 RepID=UPI0037D620AA
MRVLVVDNGSLSVGALTGRLARLGAESDVVGCGEVPRRLVSGHGALVLSGTKVPADRGTHARGAYGPLVDLVESCRVPVLGVCGGMHIMGLARGGSLVRREQRVGGHEVTVDTGDPLFAYVGDTVRLFQRHTRYLSGLSDGLAVTGWSPQCPVEFFRSADGRLVGAQAHLEFRTDGELILRRFLELAAAF